VRRGWIWEAVRLRGCAAEAEGAHSQYIRSHHVARTALRSRSRGLNGQRRGNGRLWRRLARATEAVATRRAQRRHRSQAGAVPRLRFDHAARLMREHAEGGKSRRVPRGCAPRGAGGARVWAKVHGRQAQAVVGKAARTRARTRTEARAQMLMGVPLPSFEGGDTERNAKVQESLTIIPIWKPNTFEDVCLSC